PIEADYFFNILLFDGFRTVYKSAHLIYFCRQQLQVTTYILSQHLGPRRADGLVVFFLSPVYNPVRQAIVRNFFKFIKARVVMLLESLTDLGSAGRFLGVYAHQ